jgi:hypothetical protein
MQTEKDGAIAPRFEGVTTCGRTGSCEGPELLKLMRAEFVRDVAVGVIYSYGIMHSTFITNTSIVPNLH